MRENQEKYNHLLQVGRTAKWGTTFTAFLSFQHVCAVLYKINTSSCHSGNVIGMGGSQDSHQYILELE